jgi:hypothetical protein
VIVLLVLLSYSFGHCVACSSVLLEGQATQSPKENGQKDKQHNGQKKRTEGKATQWPKTTTEGQATQWQKENDRRTSNTMAKTKGQKDKQHNGQKKKTDGQAT